MKSEPWVGRGLAGQNSSWMECISHLGSRASTDPHSCLHQRVSPWRPAPQGASAGRRGLRQHFISMRGCPLPTNLPFKVQHIQDKRSLEEGARGGRERVELLASCSLSARSLGRRQGHSSLSPPRRSMWACPDSTGRDVRESRSSRASCPQATAGVTSANVQSARARHVAEPRIGMRGRCKFTR